MPVIDITEQTFSTPRHTSFCLACGPADGPPMIFVHGWPELSLSWRHQIRFFGALGFRALAPDMRGYGRSSVYARHEAYGLEHAVADMLELLDGLDAEKAIWVGHDWGAPVAWSLASHHPERCAAVAGLCVPYATIERGLDFLISLADRRVYPEDRFPAAQWEYMRHYEESFADATRQMDADPRNMVHALFRKGSPEGMGKPARTAFVRQQGGWFGGSPQAPELPLDEDVITEPELDVFAEALARNGFFGPNSWYMNHARNAAYFARAVDDGVLDMPALFLGARYDYVCETVHSRLGQPMRELCSDLTEAVVDSGHWMAQEKPFDVNREMVRWLVQQRLV